MFEEKFNILSQEAYKRFDALCFTSNGVVKNNGELVMGAGVAKIFRDKFDGLARLAGEAVKTNGNVCQIVSIYSLIYPDIVAFPTKRHWKDDSDLNLIVKSSIELMTLADLHDWEQIALPRPGCNNGGLEWSRVKNAIKNILDDRVIIVMK